MDFFTAFDTWLQTQLASFITDRTAVIAALLEPFVATCAVLYVTFWGYLQLTGRIEQPIIEAAKRLLVLVVVIGLSLHLWAFNALFVDTFVSSPRILAAALAGAAAPSTAGAADTILREGATVAEHFLRQSSIFHNTFNSIFAYIVYAVVMLTAGYAAFLDVLSRIALTVILSLGPLFLVGLLFDSTKRFFEAWVAQLANYGLIAILTGGIVGILLQIVRREAETVAAIGSSVQVAQAISLLAACLIVLLVMRQVMPIAASLSSGVALASMGVVSMALAWSLGRSGQFGRGLMDSHSSRWDSLSRKAGYLAGAPIRAIAGAVATQGRAAAHAIGLSLRPRNEIRKAK